ncbi:MAG: hypothetical protein HGA75_10520 [Thiobacillus sp.]|nr:hypothetical protein [Thiobacillus sp.]
MKTLRAALHALIRLFLVLGLACSPLAQPMALAALAAPQAESTGGCPHHAKQGLAGSHQGKPGDCCYKKGTPCHCAMTVALPTSFAPAFEAPSSDHPVSAPRLAASVLPAPEPPPPRS